MATLGSNGVRVSLRSLLVSAKTPPAGATTRRFLHTTKPRSSGGAWAYRSIPDPKKIVFLSTRIKSEIVMGVMWWWILWHIFTEPGHLVGEFPYPKPKEWTDEQLGIPPDDE